MDKKRVKEQSPKAKKIKIIVISVIIAFVIIGIISFFVAQKIKSKKNEDIGVIITSQLEKIEEISELHTVKFRYKAIATKYDEKYADKDKEKREENYIYHVSYCGSVTAGIDLSEISKEDIIINEKKKIVIIKAPKVKLNTPKIDMDSLNFMFRKRKFENENILDEAENLCKADMESRIILDENYMKTAEANTKSVIEAFIEPIIDVKFDKDYTVSVEFGDENI